jgi:hAT family C-terminal dimerisation region
VMVDDEDYSRFVKSQFKRHLMEEESVESKSEVAKYLAEPCDSGDDKCFDILAWWKVNASRYPILSLMAKDVLAMSVSTVPSESAFSTGGRILDPFRSSLSPKTVETLVCCQNWLRSSNIHYDMRDEMEDVENYDTTTKGSLFIQL